jgi:hypothetical protein
MIERKLYQQLDLMILSENAGSITVMAEKMDLLPRQVKYMIEVLKSKYDCPIKYIPAKRSYCYTESGQCILGFHKSKVDDMLKELEALKKIIETLGRK